MCFLPLQKAVEAALCNTWTPVNFRQLRPFLKPTEGCAANIDAVKKVFHDQAVMNGVGEGQYVFGPIQNLYDLYAKVGPASGATFHVDVLDIAGNTAVGRCVIRNWHGKDFVDFHELIKENGKWKIIAKTYQQLE